MNSKKHKYKNGDLFLHKIAGRLITFRITDFATSGYAVLARTVKPKESQYLLDEGYVGTIEHGLPFSIPHCDMIPIPTISSRLKELKDS